VLGALYFDVLAKLPLTENRVAWVRNQSTRYQVQSTGARATGKKATTCKS
jgi:hypothetical protein